MVTEAKWRRVQGIPRLSGIDTSMAISGTLVLSDSEGRQLMIYAEGSRLELFEKVPVQVYRFPVVCGIDLVQPVENIVL